MSELPDADLDLCTLAEHTNDPPAGLEHREIILKKIYRYTCTLKNIYNLERNLLLYTLPQPRQFIGV